MSVCRKRKKHIKRRLITAALVIGIAVFIEFRLIPVSDAAAETEVKALAAELISRSIDEAFAETGITAEQLESVTFDEENNVTSVFTDPVAANRIKNTVLLRIQDKLSGVRDHRIDVPLGTVIGGELLSGIGPALPIFIALTGSVSGDFESGFEQGGMNQTVHKLSLRVNAEISILMPFGSVQTTAETSVLIGETVIVGRVPDGMLMHTEN